LCDQLAYFILGFAEFGFKFTDEFFVATFRIGKIIIGESSVGFFETAFNLIPSSLIGEFAHDVFDCLDGQPYLSDPRAQFALFHNLLIINMLQLFLRRWFFPYACKMQDFTMPDHAECTQAGCL